MKGLVGIRGKPCTSHRGSGHSKNTDSIYGANRVRSGVWRAMCIVSRSAAAFKVTLLTIVKFDIAWKLEFALRYASDFSLTEKSSADLIGRDSIPVDDHCFCPQKKNR